MFINNFSVRIVPGEDSGNGYVYLKDKQQYLVKLKNNHDVDCQAKLSIDGKPVGVFYIKAKSNLEVDHPIHDDGKFTFYKNTSEEGKDLKSDVSKEHLGLIQVEFVPFKMKSTESDILEKILKELENQRNDKKTTIIYERDYWWRLPYWPEPRPWWEYQPTVIYSVLGSTTATSSNLNVQTSYTSGQVSCSVAESGLTGLSGESDIQYKKEQITSPKNIENLVDENNMTIISLRLAFKDEVNYSKPRKLTAFANPIPAPID